ncbi:hypothetical protein [Flagellimonas meridianipacifica]|uniref:Uncharacterized protein n=1 Tax=Flagellimonas meridianipacifica TaxID=1080225 RepID=A0A2T0M8G1_9FLAO|nr:hypothetical protein [Allomuricauda pacifica]PRX53758.1 hypothetical protein CLV81_2145 [Allomuricauda pacifica]
MKKISFVFTILSVILVTSCAEKDETFLIRENKIGPLSKETPIADIETVFASDSVVRDSSNTRIGDAFNKIEVFEKGGKHLLTLTPNQDSVPTVENIRIFDSRYLSEKGIGLKSTFRDIKANHPIKKIVTTFNSVVIFPKESNLYFTLDKAELPANLRYTTSNIEEVQIPEDAKIKYLMLGWD